MYDLEQAALDDPFLADAIEGLLSQPAPSVSEDLNDLENRLNNRVAEDKRRRGAIFLLRRIAVAASILLILGIGYTFLASRKEKSVQFVRNRALQSAPIPQTAPTAPTGAAAPAESASTGNVSSALSKQSTIESKSIADNTALATTQAAKHRAAASAKYSNQLTDKADVPMTLTTTQPRTEYLKKINTDSTRKAKPNTSDADDVLALNNTREKLLPTGRSKSDTLQFANSNANFAVPSNKAKALASYENFYKLSPANPVVLNGKVLDYQNRPIAGAFLALNGNQGLTTTTDDKGQFQIRIRPRDTLAYLTVSMIGYDHASLAVNALSIEALQNNVIRLQPSSANLNEVVVTGMGLKRKATEIAAPSESDEKLDSVWRNAAPVIGRQAYLQYLDLAKKKLDVDSTIRGTETISFLVTRDGKLSGFKIEQSISPAHDAGIYRLVTDGPSWLVLRGKKVRASVTVNF